MLASLATPHTPPAPLPPHGPHHGSGHDNNSHDPFHALYSSLANLTLTTRETATTAPESDQATSSSPPTIPPSSSHPQPPVPGLIEVTPLFPPGDNVVFAHSSFFRRRRNHGLPTPSWQPDLPTPAQVRERAAAARLLDSGTTHGQHGNGQGAAAEGQLLVPFPEYPTRLMVKYHLPRNGNGNGSQEGKAMMLARSVAARAVPVVPEVFGWRRDTGSGEGFVYMVMPEGDVLADRWEGMSEMERGGVCTQLRLIMTEWRRLRLGGVGFVGSVDNGPLGDLVFQGCTNAGAPPPGPFPTAAAFHDYFVTMAVSMTQSRYADVGAGQIRYTPHHLFPDDVPVVFTHGALHPRNIIVSAGPNPRLVSVIGWEQAGWYPAYWELCKARLECSRHGGLGSWETRYLPWILDVEGLSRETHGWQVGSLCQYWDYFVGLM